MPTTRPRYQITETDALSEALDLAAQRWPEDAENRAKLILHLIAEGRRVISGEREAKTRARRAAIRATSGIHVYPDGYLDELRKDWTR